MDRSQEKTTVPYPPVGADGGQSLSQKPNQSIAEEQAEHKPQERDFREILRQIDRVSDPAYLPSLSMNELYEKVYPGKPPVVEGLLYPGVYLFVGAPKVGKSFLMAQLAYHVSKGLPLWGYEVRQGAVLYMALEDDYPRLQGRLYRMFGEDSAATLDISGRDLQDQRLYLKRDEERLAWELERRETEPYREPPDPVLEAVAALVTAERPEWSGTATDLAAALEVDMKANALAMRLNVRAWRLSYEYHIRYESTRTHAGRSIRLTLEPPQA